MNSLFIFSKSKGLRTAVATVFSLALSSVLLLFGAGSMPVKNLLPQGAMQGDLNAGGHNLTNVGTVNANNLVVNGSFSSPTSFPFLLGPTSKNYLFIGDSITVGPSGLTQYAAQGFPAGCQYLGMGQAGSLSYNLGMRGEKTVDMAGQWLGAISTTSATTMLTTTSGSATATVASASGISNGMCVGSANTVPNTLVTISGTTVTLSQKATTSGAVTASFATPVTDTVFSTDSYPGGAANSWQYFNATAHQLSYGISGKPTYVFLLAGTNDSAAATNSSVTMSTTAGSPNVTVTSGSYSAFVYGLVVTGANVSSALPPYIVSGYGTANLVLSSNATATGSFTATVWGPTTPLLTWESNYNTLISDAHADGDTIANGGGVIAMTLLPRGDNSLNSVVTNVMLSLENAYIKANTGGADFVFDTNSAMPAYGTIPGSPYYVSDDLHPTALGTALLARYINQQFFQQVLPSQLAWNPFAPGLLPDQWLSANIPRLNQAAVFQPWQNCVSTTVSISSGSTSGTITGSTVGINVGMYVSDPGTSRGFGPATAYITAISGTTLTFSNAPTSTDANATLYFSYSPFPGEVNIQGDLYVGAANNLRAPVQSLVHFMSYADIQTAGLTWDNVSAAQQWFITAPTSGSGDMLIGDSAAKIDLNSAGGVTIKSDTTFSTGNAIVDAAGKGFQVKEGTNAKQGTTTLSGGAATVGDTSVTANSRILLTTQAPGGTVGVPYVSARTAGTSFTITSTSSSDTSTVAYEIFEPAP